MTPSQTESAFGQATAASPDTSLKRQPGLVSALPSRPAIELVGYAVFVAGLILLRVQRL